MADRKPATPLPGHARSKIEHLLYKVPPEARYETRCALREMYALGYDDGYGHGYQDEHSDDYARRQAEREAQKRALGVEEDSHG